MTPNSHYKSAAAAQLAMAGYDRIIKQWPVPAEELRIQTRLGETFVLAFGPAELPPLVLLHGSAANSSTWASDATAYAKVFRAYAVDLPGETGKSTPARPPYEGSAYPDWLSEVFDGLGIASARITGLSLGGWAAMRFAGSWPGRVESLALIAPGGLAPAKKSFMLKALLYRPFGMWGIRRITNLVFSPQAAPQGVDEAFAFGLRNYHARRDNLPLVRDAELAALTMPVFFLGGDKDALLDTAAGAARLRQFVPHAEIRTVHNGGHALIGTAVQCLDFFGRRRGAG